MIRLKAGDLTKALKPAKPHPLKKKPKPVPVSLEQDGVSHSLAVIEARHGLFTTTIPATGNFPNSVQVDGVTLERVVSSWPPEGLLELTADRERLVIRGGKSQVNIPRLDGGGDTPIVRAPPPLNLQHTGKVVVPPDPVHKRVELADTWGFSARVPMPQHRDPDDRS